jgi:hypothetical protein
VGTTYGLQSVGKIGAPVRVLADGVGLFMPIGVTLDWSLVAAAGSDVTLLDGATVKAGRKYLRFGQVLAKVTAQPVQTLTVAGTGGTYALSGYRPDTGAYVTTGPLAYNANAAAIAAAVTAAFGGYEPVTVGGTGPWTITAPIPLLTVDATALTGGGATTAARTIRPRPTGVRRSPAASAASWTAPGTKSTRSARSCRRPRTTRRF